MRPVPVQTDWIPEGGRRVVVGPPADGDPTGDIRPVEAVIVDTPVDDRSFIRHFEISLTPEDGDLDRLRDGGRIVLAIWAAQLPPFAVEVTE